MSVAAPSIGELLREWRQRRRLSQLDLAVEAGVSTRHLSFVETGRSRPSRELVLHLAEHLDVPLRERNELLLAAGYAPAYRRAPLDAGEMAPGARRPRPDARRPRAVPGRRRRPRAGTSSRPTRPACASSPTASPRAARAAGQRAAGEPAPRRPGARASSTSPSGARTSSRGCTARSRLTGRSGAGRAATTSCAATRGVADGAGEPTPTPAALLFVAAACCARRRRRRWRFFSTIATFGTALDITVAELAIESFFPADEETDAALRAALS